MRPLVSRRRGQLGGVSAVAGAVFLVIIMITLTVGLMFWSLSVQREMTDLDIRRMSQDLEVNGVSFPAAGQVDINVTNLSPEAVHVIAVWFVVVVFSNGRWVPVAHYRVGEDHISGAWVPDNQPWHVITVRFSWHAGVTYAIELVTDLGRVFHLGYYTAS